MTPTYKTIYNMLWDLSNRDFCVKYYLQAEIIPLDAYQDLFRIYLDEYPEQKELRAEWFDGYVHRI